VAPPQGALAFPAREAKRTMTMYRKILVPTDGSPASDQALEPPPTCQGWPWTRPRRRSPCCWPPIPKKRARERACRCRFDRRWSAPQRGRRVCARPRRGQTAGTWRARRHQTRRGRPARRDRTGSPKRWLRPDRDGQPGFGPAERRSRPAGQRHRARATARVLPPCSSSSKSSPKTGTHAARLRCAGRRRTLCGTTCCFASGC
jgi:hypothetical protein